MLNKHLINAIVSKKFILQAPFADSLEYRKIVNEILKI